jgi:hypothetical protein
VDAERLFLLAPEDGEIESAGDTDPGSVRWLAAFGGRLHDPRRQKSEPKQPMYAAAIELFPLRISETDRTWPEIRSWDHLCARATALSRGRPIGACVESPSRTMRISTPRHGAVICP